MVHLTFDDGPGPSTAGLLDVLAARRVRATFFLLGVCVERRRDVAVRIARDGHVLGNHTYSHARVLDAELLAGEIARTDSLLAEVAAEAGLPLRRPPPIRLPYGPSGDADPRLAVLASLGRPHTHWTAHFDDWCATDAADLARRMREHVAACPEAVLDLHDGSRRDEPRDVTVAAVALLIDAVGARAFTAP